MAVQRRIPLPAISTLRCPRLRCTSTSPALLPCLRVARSRRQLGARRTASRMKRQRRSGSGQTINREKIYKPTPKAVIRLQHMRATRSTSQWPPTSFLRPHCAAAENALIHLGRFEAGPSRSILRCFISYTETLFLL